MELATPARVWISWVGKSTATPCTLGVLSVLELEGALQESDKMGGWLQLFLLLTFLLSSSSPSASISLDSLFSPYGTATPPPPRVQGWVRSQTRSSQ